MRIPKVQFSLRTLVVSCTVLSFAAYACHWYFDLGHENVESLPRFSGKTWQSVVCELGQVSHEVVYKVEDIKDEFRRPLLMHFPKDILGRNDVAIKEGTWKYSRYNITIWFQQRGDAWVAIDACRWRNGVEF